MGTKQTLMIAPEIPAENTTLSMKGNMSIPEREADAPFDWYQSGTECSLVSLVLYGSRSWTHRSMFPRGGSGRQRTTTLLVRKIDGRRDRVHTPSIPAPICVRLFTNSIGTIAFPFPHKFPPAFLSKTNSQMTKVIIKTTARTRHATTDGADHGLVFPPH